MRIPNPTANKVDYADMLRLQLRAMRLPEGVREYRPFPDRRFCCDLAFPEHTPKFTVEVDGGELMQGRHARAAGMASDCEKAALLTLDGWFCFRFTGGQVRSGFALSVLEKWFARHPC